MRITIAVAAAILAWFGSFLVIFLCITVLNAVVTGMAGISHTAVMSEAYKGYAGISGFIATIFAVLYAKDMNLIQSESMVEKDVDYDPTKIRRPDNVKWIND
jgi:hypothetical protein